MRYVRKLSKKSNLFKIKTAAINTEIDADVLKQELATSGNTLSFWKCENNEDLKDAMKAILLSTTSIETSQFIIIDDSILERYGIETDDSEKGVTGYKGFEDWHVNFSKLNYGQIGRLLDLIKEIAVDEANTPELKREEVKRYIVEVRQAGLLNEDSLRPELKSAIERYCPVSA